MDPARIAHVLDPAYTEGLESLPMDELRARRSACQALEVGLSYQRRMAQGRLDLVGAERNQRAGGAAAPHVGEGTEEMVEHLSGILADRGRAPGFGRMPQLMAPDEEDVDTVELDAIAGPERWGRSTTSTTTSWPTSSTGSAATSEPYLTSATSCTPGSTPSRPRSPAATAPARHRSRPS